MLSTSVSPKRQRLALVKVERRVGPITPSVEYSSTPIISNIQFLAGVFLLDVFQHFGAESNVRDALAGIVLKEGNLVGFGAALFLAGEDVADLDELLPFDHAPMDWIVDIGLLILTRL